MNYNTENEDVQCTPTNCPLDCNNVVRLADFDKSIKRAGEPQEIKSDLEVISTFGLLVYLSASFFHLLPYFLWPVRGHYYYIQKGKNVQAISAELGDLTPLQNNGLSLDCCGVCHCCGFFLSLSPLASK